MRGKWFMVPAVITALVGCLVTAPAYADGEITVQKFISADGGATWLDASEAPGPIVTEGSVVKYWYVVQNNTATDLNYELSDTDFGFVGSGTLTGGTSTEYFASGFAVLDQHANVVTVTATTTDGVTTYSGEDTANYYGIVQSQSITIDLKPGGELGDPSSINLKSRGMVPLALISSAEFDATAIFEGEIAPVVLFAGATAVRWAIEDVNGDGIDDVILHFRTQELTLDETSTGASLTIGYGYDPLGNLISSYGAQDTVNIVPKGKGQDKGGPGFSGNSQGSDKGNGGNKGGNNKGNGKGKNKD